MQANDMDYQPTDEAPPVEPVSEGDEQPGPAAPAACPPAPGKQKWRWARRLVILLACLGVVYGCHAPLLRAVAGYLVVEEPVQAPFAVLILKDVDRRFDRAAGLYRDGSAAPVLLVESVPKRLERAGILPSDVILGRQQLALRGVPAEAVTELPGQARTDWDRARLLGEWLHQQPDGRVVVLCRRFSGRRLLAIMDKVLDADAAHRVRLAALPERAYDERTWWRNRQGVVDVFNNYVGLAYVRLCGEDSGAWQEWDPEEYRRTLP